MQHLIILFVLARVPNSGLALLVQHVRLVLIRRRAARVQLLITNRRIHYATSHRARNTAMLTSLDPIAELHRQDVPACAKVKPSSQLVSVPRSICRPLRLHVPCVPSAMIKRRTLNALNPVISLRTVLPALSLSQATSKLVVSACALAVGLV